MNPIFVYSECVQNTKLYENRSEDAAKRQKQRESQEREGGGKGEREVLQSIFICHQRYLVARP